MVTMYVNSIKSSNYNIKYMNYKSIKIIFMIKHQQQNNN